MVRLEKRSHSILLLDEMGEVLVNVFDLSHDERPRSFNFFGTDVYDVPRVDRFSGFSTAARVRGYGIPVAAMQLSCVGELKTELVSPL